MGEPLSIEIITERMMTPDVLTHREVREYIMYLTAIYSRQSVEYAKALSACAYTEAQLVQEDMTSAKVKQIVRGSKDGQDVIMSGAQLKGLEELIRSLKTAQKSMLQDEINHIN